MARLQADEGELGRRTLAVRVAQALDIDQREAFLELFGLVPGVVTHRENGIIAAVGVEQVTESLAKGGGGRAGFQQAQALAVGQPFQHPRQCLAQGAGDGLPAGGTRQLTGEVG